MSGDDETLSGPLPEDFLAEFEEHLAAVERALLDLERDGSLEEPAAADLLRRLHTLKGLSGMVGLGAAEALAHAMESALRALRLPGPPPGKEAMDGLVEAGRGLGRALADRKAGAPTHDFSLLLKRLTETVEREPGRPEAPRPAAVDSAITLNAAQQRELASSARAGLEVLRATFTPSAALSARGVSVATVRARLERRGRIITASPVVRPGGAMSFEFLLAAPKGAFESPDWEADGVGLHPYEPPLTGEGEEDSPLLVPSNTIRVGMDKLDSLMRVVGELVVARARLAETGDGLARWVEPRHLREFEDASSQLERQVRLLRESVTRIRLVPVGTAFARMAFAVRELARESGKQIRFELTGQETELDKFVVDRMTEPILHLVRNAAAHGIESPEERKAAGKPPEGRVSLRASAKADRVIVEVEDDGAGVDEGAVRRRGAELGVAASAGLLETLCAPGLSTAPGVDLGSGRGVGMSAVWNTVRDLGGRLTMRSKPGAGAAFKIEIPVTLLITQALLVSDGGRTYAVPASTVEEVLESRTKGAPVIGGLPVLSYRGGTVAVSSLAEALGGERTEGRFVLVVREGGLAFSVERVLGQKEIVVSALSDPWVRSPGVSGATRLPDGDILLILDLRALSAARELV